MMADMDGCCRAILLACVTAATLAAAATGAQLADEQYLLPLVKRYAVFREDALSAREADDGRYQLVELNADPQGPAYYRCYGWTNVLPVIEQVGVVGPVIVGKSPKGYFLLDTNRDRDRLQTFDSLDLLQTALATTGIAGPFQLTSPDAMAASQPARVLYPWRYRIMANAMGCSDGEWSLIVQLAGLVTAFLIGLLSRPGRSLMIPAVVLGVLVNIAAQVILGDGGGPAFVGFVLYPLLYYFSAVAGYALRALVRLIRRRSAVTVRTDQGPTRVQ
jgi:hypothetical protein